MHRTEPTGNRARHDVPAPLLVARGRAETSGVRRFIGSRRIGTVRRYFLLALPALLGLAASARAGVLCGCKTRCIEPPEDNPKCPCPCEKRLKLCPFEK